MKSSQARKTNWMMILRLSIFVLATTMIYGCTNIDTEGGVGGVVGGQPVSPESLLDPDQKLKSVRIIFNDSNFTDILSFLQPNLHTQYTCPGDVFKYYKTEGADYSSVSGAPTLFSVTNASDSFPTTQKPAWVKHVSVDITQSYFLQTPVNGMATDARCSYRGLVEERRPSACATFDHITPDLVNYYTTPPPAAPGPNPFADLAIFNGAPAPSPYPTPYVPVDSVSGAYPFAPFIETGFYRVKDDWCAHQGPVLDADVETTKSKVGSVYFDFDRTYLGAGEDVLMNITYLAFPALEGSDSTTYPFPVSTFDATTLKVRLMSTGQSYSSLTSVIQPRSSINNTNDASQVVVDELASLKDTFGQVRTEQVYVPFSAYAQANRVVLERVRGSYYLYQVDLYRLGSRTIASE